jgi:hypothetical protein
MSLLVNSVSSPSFRGPAPAHSAADADALVAHVRRELGGFGFDVVEPACLGWCAFPLVRMPVGFPCLFCGYKTPEVYQPFARRFETL